MHSSSSSSSLPESPDKRETPSQSRNCCTAPDTEEAADTVRDAHRHAQTRTGQRHLGSNDWFSHMDPVRMDCCFVVLDCLLLS